MARMDKPCERAALLAAVLWLFALMGCGFPPDWAVMHSHSQPDPHSLFLAATIAVPAVMTNGSDSVFTATIIGGTAPYTVEWDFGGGATPGTDTQFNQTTQTSSSAVKMLAGDWVAKVTVTDAIGIPYSTSGVAYHVSSGP